VGVVRIVLEGSERGTRIAHLFQRYPVRVMFPRVCSSEVEEAVLVNTAGGVAGGDRLEFALTALGNASAAVTSQAGREGVPGVERARRRISTRLKVSEAAKLAWPAAGDDCLQSGAPQPGDTDRSGFRSGAARASSGSCWVARRTGEELAGGHIDDSWRVRIDGRLAWADSFRVTDGMFPHLRSRALLSSSNSIATLVCFGPHPPRAAGVSFATLAPSARLPVLPRPWLEVCWSPAFAAERSWDLRLALHSLLREFDREFGPGPFRVPKMWSC